MHETVSVPGWYEQLRASGCTGRTSPTMTTATRRVAVGCTDILRQVPECDLSREIGLGLP